ncbi:hypothetical protein JCM10908_000887 [Rhodotorula pacifica]|uniref:uncharacterized protein n=1 Tax=Rhodotorula pacifica TaxID=1495444 RepID=UPI00316E4A07
MSTFDSLRFGCFVWFDSKSSSKSGIAYKSWASATRVHPTSSPLAPAKLASASPPVPAPAASGSGGLKLTFKLGKSAAASAAPSVAPAYTPAPAVPQSQPVYASSPAVPAAAPGTTTAGQRSPYSAHETRYAQASAGAHAPYGARRHPYEQAQQDNDPDDEDYGVERVPATKYRKLKKLYLAAVQSRDNASLSLFRAQKLIARLRDDKSALMDRVIELEMAAGVTSYDVAALQDQTLKSEREAAFPLLHPPILPSLEDRPQKPPVLTTNTEMTGDDYNKPSGPAPLPKTFPPRQRSQPLRTAIAAQKLRDEHTAQRIALALPPPSFPAVAVLGLAGSAVAHNVERALAGESFDAVASTSADTGPRGAKRRRESSTGVGSGSGRARGGRASAAATDSSAPGFNNLPNPFALAGAIPVGAPMSRNNADAIAAAAPVGATPAPAAPTATVPAEPTPVAPSGDIDVAMDDNASVGSGEGAAEEDGGDYKPATGAGAKRGGGRKSDTGAAKPKKVRQHGLTSGTFSIPPIPRHADGTPVMPIMAGIMSIRNLGTVDPRDGFHTERYIFPVGYEAIRKYPSMIDPLANVEYTCRIVDGGDLNPRFELYPADQPGQVITSGTPTGAWTQVVRATNKVRERNHSGSVSGPDYYGLSHNIVKALIQELPGADRVPGYIWQTFVEEGPGERRPANAPKKPMGARRKSRVQDHEESPGYDVGDYDGGGQQQQQQAYGTSYLEPNGEYASPADFTGGDLAVTPGNYAAQHDYTPASLQNLLAASVPSSNPYDLPTGAAAHGAGNSTDPFLGMGGVAAAPYDPYALPTNSSMMDPSYGADASFAYNMPPGGQPMEYPSSDEESG